MFQIIFFLAFSLALTIVSWTSLRTPGSHGFFRFFAWEAILALVVINTPLWFVNPFAWHQVISWCLLIACLVPLGLGVQRLHGRGEPGPNRAGDSSLLAFEKTTRLVTDGIYRYIRHPLYSSLLLLGWGAFFKSPSWIGGALGVTATAFLVLTARADEAECIRYFGPAYRDYMNRTRMFVPYLI